MAQNPRTLMDGSLYVVATPIGNLEDMTYRAVRVLQEADIVAAEDTRHSRRLLDHFGISRRLTSLHEHNEARKSTELLAHLQAGRSVALISDAGTPLISDPGARFVRRAVEAGVTVRTVPGPSALTAALSICGLPTDRIRFEGFTPSAKDARRRHLSTLANETATLVFFESPRRVRGSVNDMRAVFGPDRRVALCKEMTKVYESTYFGSLDDVGGQLDAESGELKGEFVVVVEGSPAAQSGAADDESATRLLGALLRELPLKRAAKLAAELTGKSRNDLYRLGLSLSERD